MSHPIKEIFPCDIAVLCLWMLDVTDYPSRTSLRGWSGTPSVPWVGMERQWHATNDGRQQLLPTHSFSASILKHGWL